MLFFRKSSTAKIQDIGQVKFSEEQGFMPFIAVEPSSNKKVYHLFFEDSMDSMAELFYVRAFTSVGLAFQFGKYKIGFDFDLRKHLKPLSGIMKTGWIAIRDKETERMLTFNLDAVKLAFNPEWRDKVVPDIIDMSLKENGVQVEDREAYEKKVITHLENNWMVEED